MFGGQDAYDEQVGHQLMLWVLLREEWRGDLPGWNRREERMGGGVGTHLAAGGLTAHWGQLMALVCCWMRARLQRHAPQ